MCAALSIGLLKDEDFLVPELRNLRRRLSTWERKKLKVQLVSGVKRKHAILRKADEIIRNSDPGYVSALDAIDAVEKMESQKRFGPVRYLC